MTKGSLVMLKAKLEDDLYTIEESTLVQLSYDVKENLWLMRLGHVSVQGLEILSNYNLLNGEKINTLEFCGLCVLRKQM